MVRQRFLSTSLFLAATLLIVVLVGLSPVQAQNACAITVGTINDLTGDCDLPGGITIPADAPTTTINGNGYAIRAAASQPQFTVEGGAALTLKNLTLTESNAPGGDAIFNIIGGSIAVENSVISNNTASSGSVIFNLVGGAMTVKNSVISDNTVSGGGVVFNLIGSALTVNNSIVDDITNPAGSATFNSVGSTTTAATAQAEAAIEPTTDTAPAQAGAACQLTTDYRVNLRAEAASDGDILDIIPYETTLMAMGESGGWYQVTWEGQTGWVMQEYVTAVCP